jgi:hypothetical protein
VAIQDWHANCKTLLGRRALTFETFDLKKGQFIMRVKLKSGLVVALSLASSLARADSLELVNGSLIQGKFVGGTGSEISFQVGSSVQKYAVPDIAAIKFDSHGVASAMPMGVQATAYVTIPAGTHIVVRTIDSVDSTKNQVGDRFQSSLEEPLMVDGNLVAPKGTDVYGRLTASKESGTFTGRSELRLELTGIAVNGHTVPLVTGEYELTGKSRGASTAKRTVGGAALGSLIGAIAGGGEGAAIGAGAGAGVGAGSEIITKGDQVSVPSETLLDFTLQQDVSIPTRPI